MEIEKIIKEMSLEDKIAMCSGKNFWQTKSYEKYGIPSMFMCDGPHGLRKQEDATDMLGLNKSVPSTCFPTAVTSANTFDVEILQKMGKAIGEEARNQKVGMVLGPGACLKRNPLCGRNFEYFSEDPYLAGKLAAGFIKGVEGEGVSTSLKHFACNQQELDRLRSDGVIDERTLRELYLTAFEIAVKEANPATLMCAYPKINGVQCSDNKKLLSDILRDEWGYKGAVITDWGAMNNRIEGFKAGCDLSMPGGSAYMEKECVKAVRNGTLDEELINTSVRRILQLVKKSIKAQTGEDCDYDAHDLLAEEIALKGAVLLKNDDNLLPLTKGKKVAVIGHMAKNMRYQGAGSSHINPTKLSNPIDYLDTDLYAPGCDELGNSNESLLKEVSEVSKKADVVVVIAGLTSNYESEGFDRETMDMPKGHNEMILKAAKVNPNVVVVLLSGSAVTCPWIDCVKSVLYMGLPGQAGGKAISKLLTGEVNPSGRLSESWPIKYDDVPSSKIFAKTKDALYMEGIYVGYRYYDKAKKEVLFPFGYGLSYTSFKYSDLKVDGNNVSVKVTNTGNLKGEHCILLYVKNPQNGIHRPIKELRRFKKVSLLPNETKEVEFVLDERCFSIYDDGFKVPSGKYKIVVGDLEESIIKEGVDIKIPSWQKGSFYETCIGYPNEEEWKKTLEYKYCPRPILKKGEFTLNSSIEEMKDHSLLMRLMYIIVCRVLSKGKKPNFDDPEFKMMAEAALGGPLRGTAISSGIGASVFEGLLEISNGHFFKGISKILGH